MVFRSNAKSRVELFHGNLGFFYITSAGVVEVGATFICVSVKHAQVNFVYTLAIMHARMDVGLLQWQLLSLTSDTGF